MTMSISKFTAKVIGDKRRWREYKARVRRLPPNYAVAVDAIEHYLMHFGVEDADSAAALFEAIADLFEQSAADGKTIREVVGENPLEFIEALLRNYPEQKWRSREQQRLISAIDLAAGDKP
jgi:DNA-binding ferritin-like protein (Dps family)